MKDISGLIHSLNGCLGWNKARITCFVRILLDLFTVRTINLQEIAFKTAIASYLRRWEIESLF